MSQLHPYAKIAWTVCSSLYQVSVLRLHFCDYIYTKYRLGCEEATLDGFQFGLISQDYGQYLLNGGRVEGSS